MGNSVLIETEPQYYHLWFICVEQRGKRREKSREERAEERGESGEGRAERGEGIGPLETDHRAWVLYRHPL